MQHPDEGTIHSWLDGALSADEATRIEAHVTECAECAAAVAEARGFIAASSRILTALDNVPRGVVPVAPPVKTRNWPAWRAAAAVLVVALGSLVVLRDRVLPVQDKQAAVSAKSAVSTPSTAMADTGSPGNALADAATVLPASPEPATKSADGAANKAPEGAGSRSKVTPSSSTTTRESVNEPKVAQTDQAISAPPSIAQGAVAGFEARRMSVPRVAAPTQTAQAAGVGSVTALDAGSEVSPLKEVRREQLAGGTRITYALQRDTVTLVEQDVVTNLGRVVPTAVAPQAASSPTASRAAADATTQSAANAERAQRTIELSAAKTSAAPSAPLPVREEGAQVNTLSWRDAATGKLLTLSGRVSREQLAEIKRRIEVERAASKKTR